jgi:hypothetical protein
VVRFGKHGHSSFAREAIISHNNFPFPIDEQPNGIQVGRVDVQEKFVSDQLGIDRYDRGDTAQKIAVAH